SVISTHRASSAGSSSASPGELSVLIVGSSVPLDVEEAFPQPAETQDLFDDGRHARQDELAAGVLEATMAADQPADAAGIDIIDTFQVQADLARMPAGTEQVGQRVCCARESGLTDLADALDEQNAIGVGWF